MSDSGGVSIARSRSNSSGENRFYHPPPIRHRLQQAAAPAPSRVYRPRNSKSERKKKNVESDECAASTTGSTNSKSSVESEKRVDSKITNFDRFLEFTTPRVHAQFLPKRNVGGRRNGGAESNPYFVLGDLWESFKEWSAYGAGVPLLLDGDESVIQYYVPYLSGIQLYIDPSKNSSRQRRRGEESDLDSPRGTSSDGNSDYGAERGASNRSQHNIADRNVQRLSNLSLGMNPSLSSSSDEGETCSPPGDLVYEYLERDPPFTREPLADKILLLASRFPELKSYRSCDLSPSSWISVAWYPIYRIPVGPTLQNLDACFITFHSLSTAVNSTTTLGPHTTASSIGDSHNPLKLSLHIFGLAFYKFKVAFWNSDAVQECQKASSLQRDADNWLRQLQVNHPDFNFFVSRNAQRRCYKKEVFASGGTTRLVLAC